MGGLGDPEDELPELTRGEPAPATPAAELTADDALGALAEEETAPLGETVIVIGEEVTEVDAAAALFELGAAADDEGDKDELGLERIRTPVLTVMSGLVAPLRPAAPGIATGTVATWTTYPPVPPFDGRTAATAGATEKPTSAISPMTSVHHVFECLALISERRGRRPHLT